MASAADGTPENPDDKSSSVGKYIEKPHMAAMWKMSWKELMASLDPPEPQVHVPSPRRQAAGKLNRQKRKGITEAGRQKLRETAAKNKPWQHSTGPTSVLGRLRSAQNGRHRQLGPISMRQAMAEMRASEVSGADLQTLCEMLLSELGIKKPRE